MRISTLQIFNIANKSMSEANQEIAKTQTQLSTGQRILKPSDDPVASVKIMEINQSLARIDQYGKNIDIAENNLALEESTLNTISNLLQRVREIAVQAGNTAVYTDKEYDALASEVDSRLDELKNLMNTRNSAGDYIFSGYKGGEQPFTGSATEGFRYQGTEGQVSIKVSEGTKVAVTDSGKAVFVDIPSAKNNIKTSVNEANRATPPATISIGQVVDQSAYDDFYPEDMVITFNEDSAIAPAGKNFSITERSTGNVIQPYENFTYSSGDELIVNGVSVRINGIPASAEGSEGGDQFFIDSAPNQDVLTTLARFSAAMKNVDDTQESKTLLAGLVADTLNNINGTQDNIQTVTSSLGARMNTLETTRELHLDTELVSKEILSNLQDLDYAEAASRLSAQVLILEAAQASFARISQLSLFNRL